MSQQDSESARRAKRIDEVVQERLHEIEFTVLQASQTRWADVFAKSNMGRLLVTVGLAISQQITGIIFIEFYCTTILVSNECVLSRKSV